MASNGPAQKPSSGKPSFTRLERLLIVLGLVIVAVMAYSYYADIPLRKLFSPWGATDQTGRVIGTVISVEGRVLRQRSGELDFKPIGESQRLFANDTIMTGPDSTITIVLANNKRVTLKPNSLVKLAFGNDLNGEVRIDVLQGGTDENLARVVPRQPQPAQKPAPPPTAAHPIVTEASPAPEAILAFSAREFLARRKTIELSFKLDRQPQTLVTRVSYVEAANGRRTRIASTRPAIESSLRARFEAAVSRPGQYEWDVLDKDAVLLRQNFRIRPETAALRALPPLNTSMRLIGERVKENFDGFVLRWEPLGASGTYVVRIYKGKDPRPFAQHATTDTSLRLKPSEFPFKPMSFYYTIEKTFPDGFIATSGPQNVATDFAAPKPSSPAPDLVYDQDKLYSANNTVFLTWGKSNFVSRYKVQVANEPRFKHIVFEKVTRDNYAPYVGPPSGDYYWRVQSEVEGNWSSFSQPLHFKIQLEN